jgi:hypothetical protein
VTGKEVVKLVVWVAIVALVVAVYVVFGASIVALF